MNLLRLLDPVTGNKKSFIPINSKDVKIYCCGPTVYDDPHLGHARTYVHLDMLRRCLRHSLGYRVRTVMNVTDLDEKILKKGGPPIAQHYEQVFFETMGLLNIDRPDFAPRVTDFLEAAHTLSDTLDMKGYVYCGNCPVNLYFKTKKYLDRFDRVFPDTVTRDVSMNAAVSPASSTDQNEKQDPRDFALWKQRNWFDVQGKNHNVVPGWHLECAAICAHHFGDTVDIHLGGIDLQFPHHENELALGRVLFDKKNWVRHCLYVGHLHIEGKKMSKSLKNFTTVQEMQDAGYSPLALRYLFLKHPYEKPMNFNVEEMAKAQIAYDTFMHHLKNIQQHLMSRHESKGAAAAAAEKGGQLKIWLNPDQPELDKLNVLNDTIDHCLMDNLNTPEALQKLEAFVQVLSTQEMTKMSREWLLYTFNYVYFITDSCFGLIQRNQQDRRSDEMFQILQTFRSKVRVHALLSENEEEKTCLLTLCDGARDDMNQKGYYVTDKKE